MHRLKSHLSCIGLAAQAARRQPKNNCDFDKIGDAGSAAGKGAANPGVARAGWRLRRMARRVFRKSGYRFCFAIKFTQIA
jgi:hypothetical protein